MGLWWGGVTEVPWHPATLTGFALTTRLGHGWAGCYLGDKARSHLALHAASLPGWHGASMIKLKVIPFPCFFFYGFRNHDSKGKKAEALPHFPLLGGKAAGQEDECGPATRRKESDVFFFKEP